MRFHTDSLWVPPLTQRQQQVETIKAGILIGMNAGIRLKHLIVSPLKLSYNAKDCK